MSSHTHILTLSDVSDLLRVPKSTVYKLAQQGRLPAFKVGKHWRFLESDIDGWLTNHGGQQGASDVLGKTSLPAHAGNRK